MTTPAPPPPETGAPPPPPPPPTTTTTTTTTEPPPETMTYWVSFSKKVRLGAPLAVSVYVAEATGPVTLRLELMDLYGRTMQEGQNFTLQATSRCRQADGHGRVERRMDRQIDR